MAKPKIRVQRKNHPEQDDLVGRGKAAPGFLVIDGRERWSVLIPSLPDF
jgi:hypothetical protein